jgi:hypothetical protein
MSQNSLPLSIRDVAPGEGAIRLTGIRTDGLPDGIHTGGAWLWRGECWKPCDGRPYANAECHVPTDEEAALTAMAGQPFFPRNWRAETCGGRRFIVRPVARVLPRDLPWATLTEQDALAVEAALRAFNEAGWELGDPVTLARDPDDALFIVDLSAAHHLAGTGLYGADDLWRIERFLAEAGFNRLLDLRRAARAVQSPVRFAMAQEYWSLRHVYACKDAAAARAVAGSAFLTSAEAAGFYPAHKQAEALTMFRACSPGWLLTANRLPPDLCQEHGLVWGWSPLRERESHA